jgi:AAA15 family ATPase/GTPase
MRLNRLKIKEFKNLIEFNINFDQESMTTVLIGRNGTGKSNLIEALVIIFRDLDLGNEPTFTYELEYECNGFKVEIVADKHIKPHYKIKTNSNEISFAKFIKDVNTDGRSVYLPRHVFAYYSGPSNRLELHFNSHQTKFYKELLNWNNEALRPLFYARLIHSQFVLLSYFSYGDRIKKIPRGIPWYYWIRISTFCTKETFMEKS